MDVKTYLQKSLKSDNKDLCKGWKYLKENITDELKEQIVKWQYETMTKGELNTLISNLLCELTRYDKEIMLLVTKNTD